MIEKNPAFGAKHEVNTETGEKREAGLQPEIRFDAKRGTLLLGLGGPESIDPAFLESASQEGFQPKGELHLTVLGFKQGNVLKKILKERPELTAHIEELAAQTEWGLQATGEMYKLTKSYEGEEEPRQSVIEMVDCPGGEQFIAGLNEMTGGSFEEQPPHVTLATKGNPQGIGVNTAQDIIAMGERLA